jgi:hypothetical protein
LVVGLDFIAPWPNIHSAHSFPFSAPPQTNKQPKTNNPTQKTNNPKQTTQNKQPHDQKNKKN